MRILEQIKRSFSTIFYSSIARIILSTTKAQVLSILRAIIIMGNVQRKSFFPVERVWRGHVSTAGCRTSLY